MNYKVRTVWKYDDVDRTAKHVDGHGIVHLGWTCYVLSDGTYKLRLDYETRSEGFMRVNNMWIRATNRMLAPAVDTLRLEMARKAYEKYIAELILEEASEGTAKLPT